MILFFMYTVGIYMLFQVYSCLHTSYIHSYDYDGNCMTTNMFNKNTNT